MPKGTITVSFDTLTSLLRQYALVPDFTVTGVWTGCQSIDVQIQGDAIDQGFHTEVIYVPEPLSPSLEAVAQQSQPLAPDPTAPNEPSPAEEEDVDADVPLDLMATAESRAVFETAEMVEDPSSPVTIVLKADEHAQALATAEDSISGRRPTSVGVDPKPKRGKKR